jgi:hypothetical protein
MASELDIYRSASVLIEKHGVDAWFVAATRADEWLVKGNHEGHDLWTAIVRAIQVIQETEPPEGEARH